LEVSTSVSTIVDILSAVIFYSRTHLSTQKSGKIYIFTEKYNYLNHRAR